MKKGMIALLALCAAFVIGFTPVFAAGSDSPTVRLVSVDEAFDSGLSAYGEARYSRGVEIDGTIYPLYPEFDSQSDALDALKEQEADALAFVQEKYGLNPLSDTNYARYQNAAGMEFGSAEGELSDSLGRIDQFFDIYENKRQNDEVADMVRRYNLPLPACGREELLGDIRTELSA